MNNVIGVNFASTTSIKTILSGGKFTYSTWVYTTTTSSYLDLIGFQGAAPYWGYTLQVRTDGPSVFVRMQDTGGVWQYYTAALPGTISLSTWNLLTVSYDATTGNITAYLNGYPGGTLSGVKHTGSTGSIFRLGIQGWSGFTGYVDEVRVYNRALSAAEILALYNATK